MSTWSSAVRATARRWVFVLALVAFGCGGSAAPSTSAVGVPKPGAQAPAATPRHRLLDALRSIERPSGVLDGLSARARADLQFLTGQLGQQEKAELTKDGPLAQARPLLHLAVGGSSPAALYELATSVRLAEELVAARQLAGKTDVDDLVGSARQVAVRAASSWLRDRVVEAASPKGLTPRLCDQIDRAAQTLGRRDISRMARELAVTLEPSADRWIALAWGRARELDADAARGAIAEAERLAGKDRMLLQRIRRARRIADSAATARAAQGKTLELDASVTAARAHLDLSREDDARKLLEPHRAAAAKHLAVAATLSVAELEGTICPGLAPAMGNALLCAVAWQRDPRSARVTSLLQQAWDSGGGRDERGADAYIGLVQVVPWMYGAIASPSNDRAELEKLFRSRLAALRTSSQDAVAVSQGFAGYKLFVDALAAGFEVTMAAKPGDHVALTEASQKELSQRALELGKKMPDHRFAQAGVLGVAAMMLQEQDVTPLLAVLPEDVDGVNLASFQVLRLWTAVTNQKQELAAAAAGEIAALLPHYGEQPLERAKLVLLMAESDASLTASPKAYAVLDQVAKQLLDEGVPTELRLRAAIDAAGAKARAGGLREAAELLERTVTTARINPGNATELDLGLVAASYLFVLRARSSKGAERTEYRAKLAELGDQPTSQNAPAGIRLWRELWLREVDYLIAEEQCGVHKICLDRAKKKRGTNDAEVAKRVGAVAAKVFRAGTLPAGTLRLSFNFSGGVGLEAMVIVEPRLLAAELPPSGK